MQGTFLLCVLALVVVSYLVACVEATYCSTAVEAQNCQDDTNPSGCPCPPPFVCKTTNTGVRECFLTCNSYDFYINQQLLCGAEFPACVCPARFKCHYDYHHNRPKRLCRYYKLQHRQKKEKRRHKKKGKKKEK
jgi:hypothetical protein